MATTLEAIVQFTGVPAATPTAKAHGLNVSGIGVIPDRYGRKTTGNFTITFDAVNVTVTNNGSSPANIDVWCKFIYSPERAFGSSQVTVLTGSPFEMGGPLSGSGGSGNGDHYGSCIVNNVDATPLFLANSDATRLTGIASNGVGRPVITLADAGIYVLHATPGAGQVYTAEARQNPPGGTVVEIYVFDSATQTLSDNVFAHVSIFGPY